MFSIERKVVDYILKKKDFLFLLIMSILGLVIRVSGFEVMTTDMYSFLMPWVEHFKNNGGIDALSQQVGDYNILYQSILALASYLPYRTIVLVKWISIIFDFVLAFFTGLVVKKWISEKLFITAYAVVLFWPTVVINSAYWGQCDSAYVCFLLMSLFFLYEGKHIRAFALLGIAFGFKLQSAFVLPVFIIMYLVNKKFSICNFLATAAAFVLTGILGFIKGRSILDVFTIYLNQTNTYEYLSMNSTGLWSLWHSNNYKDMKSLGIWLTIAVIGGILYYLLKKEILIDSPEVFLGIALIVLWTCLIFLPAMHERYDFMLAILLIILALFDRKYIVPLFVVFAVDVYNYGNYFMASMEQQLTLTILFLAAYIYTIWLVKKKISFMV